MAKLTIVEEKPVPPPKKYVLELSEAEMLGLVDMADQRATDSRRASDVMNSVWTIALSQKLVDMSRETRGCQR